jgi:2-polyprenyl-3-methyl-5-hydroxy-6-metoxy-1,4-benzoquinol methylase
MPQTRQRAGKDAAVYPLKLHSACHCCGNSELEIIEGYEQMRRVSSDCRPWRPGGRLAHCRACDLVQTVVDDLWQSEAEEVYRDYQIYHQSGGAEQAVFQQGNGVAQTRSRSILEALARYQDLPAAGRWLDIGCGNGATLQACSRTLPAWSLSGTEVHDVERSRLEALPGFETLAIGPDAEVAGQFDVVSLIHVIEHIPSPVEFLRRFIPKLKPNGLLLLEVPDCSQNPFILMVADHCSHFSVDSLAAIVEKAGYRCLHATNSWVTKEVTIVAEVADEQRGAGPLVADGENSQGVLNGWKIVRDTVAQVSKLAKSVDYGIFGTAIAATWLDAEVGQTARFFVDEDPNRAGHELFGRPIIAPTGLKAGDVVFIALPPAIADRVATRMTALRPDVQFIVPVPQTAGDERRLRVFSEMDEAPESTPKVRRGEDRSAA